MLTHVNMGKNGSDEMGRDKEWGDGSEWAIAAAQESRQGRAWGQSIYGWRGAGYAHVIRAIAGARWQARRVGRGCLYIHTHTHTHTHTCTPTHTHTHTQTHTRTHTHMHTNTHTHTHTQTHTHTHAHTQTCSSA